MYRPILIAQLQQLVNAQSDQDRENKNFKHTGGWCSTNKQEPERGHVFKPVKDGEVLEFKDKYGKTHTGVIASYSLNTNKKINVSVATTRASATGQRLFPITYSLSLKEVEGIIGKEIKVKQPKF